jgi:hypothetical protein
MTLSIPECASHTIRAGAPGNPEKNSRQDAGVAFVNACSRQSSRWPST